MDAFKAADRAGMIEDLYRSFMLMRNTQPEIELIITRQEDSGDGGSEG